MEVNKLVIGTAQFGLKYGINNKTGKVDTNEIIKILNTCKKNNIQYFDTAHSYGDSEKILGQYFSNKEIISKFPEVQNKNELIKIFYETLSNIGQDKLYGYLAHNPKSIIENSEIWEQLLEFKTSGLVRKIGYSLYEPVDLEKLLEKNKIPDIIQIPYSILDNKFDNYLKYLKKINVEIHVRSIFLQGLYFVNPEDLHISLTSIKPFLKKIQYEAKNQNSSLEFFLMSYVLQKKEIDKIVIGIDSNDQLLGNLIHDNTKSFDYSFIQEFPKIDENLINPSLWKI